MVVYRNGDYMLEEKDYWKAITFYMEVVQPNSSTEEIENYIDREKESNLDKYLSIFKMLTYYFDRAMGFETCSGDPILEDGDENRLDDPWIVDQHSPYTRMLSHAAYGEKLKILIRICVARLAKFVIKSIIKNKGKFGIGSFYKKYFGLIRYSYINAKTYIDGENTDSDNGTYIPYIIYMSTFRDIKLGRQGDLLGGYDRSVFNRNLEELTDKAKNDFNQFTIGNEKFFFKTKFLTYDEATLQESIISIIRFTDSGGLVTLEHGGVNMVFSIKSLKEALKSTPEFKRGDYDKFFKQFDEKPKPKKGKAKTEAEKLDIMYKKLKNVNPGASEKKLMKQANKLLKELK